MAFRSASGKAIEGGERLLSERTGHFPMAGNRFLAVER